jgi:hypothetical protein
VQRLALLFICCGLASLTSSKRTGEVIKFLIVFVMRRVTTLSWVAAASYLLCLGDLLKRARSACYWIAISCS